MKNFKEFALLLLSALLTAMAVQLFYVQHSLTPGGITGMSITLSSITGVSVDIISLSISIPLLIISTIFLGGKFGVKTAFITFMVPVFINIIPLTFITNNVLIASILGGLLVGISIGIAIRCSCATGGTDVIAMILNKIFKNIPLSNILFICDGIIVLSSWAITGDFMMAIYSLVSLLIIMITIKFITRKL